MNPEGELLLLDTHVWLWLVDGVERELSSSALRHLSRASREGRILVSVISVWEVAMLVRKHRLRLVLQVDEWVDRALRAPGVRLAELTPRIAIESTRLPASPHGDPADRILIATARLQGARLVTRDAGILGYAERGGLAVLDAGR